MADVSHNLLLNLYACPTEPKRWHGVLDCISAELGVASAVVQRFRQEGQLLKKSWEARDSVSSHHSVLHDRLVNNSSNPRLNLKIVRPLKHHTLMRDEERFSYRCPELAELRKRLRVIGLGNSIGLGIHCEAGVMFSLILHRNYEDRRGFNCSDEAFLLQLAPHLEQVHSLTMRLNGYELKSQRLQDMANLLNLGLVICSADRTIEWSNEAAQQIMQRSPHLSQAYGCLTIHDREEREKLDAWIKGLQMSETSHSAAPILSLGRGGHDVLQLQPVSSTGSDGAIILMLIEPQCAPGISSSELTQLFGLTPAEAMVAMALSAGSSLKQYAATRGIAEGSARNQLKQVLAKTGSDRQSDLVRQICQSIPGQRLRRNSSPIPDVA